MKVWPHLHKKTLDCDAQPPEATWNADSRDAGQVLSTAKQLPMWGMETAGKADSGSFYDLLVAEKDIVRMILLLTGMRRCSVSLITVTI